MRFLILFLFMTTVYASEKPNILWISVEDMSPTLGCYGDEYANTTVLDAFAKRSVKFENAFATAPVCSPSRSCLINGLPATSQGTQQMRSAQKIPSYMLGFPTLLRKAGYYTSNNVKTDYNSSLYDKIIKSSWDESSGTADWSKRPKGKPFFSVVNLMTTHQSRTMVWPYEKFQSYIQSKLSKEDVKNPNKTPLPEYYPNTPVVRKTVARFYDCVTRMDAEVGGMLKRLQDEGLAENTIIFFFSDHGSGMPRHKRALLDSGMKVPLLIHIPEKFRSIYRLDHNSQSLVNFADFAPTVLEMAGLSKPSYMEGESLLSKDIEKREYIFGHRDRVDEVRDMARSVRGPRYLYIKNFMPHLGYNQPTAWPDLGEIRHEFYKQELTPELTAGLRHFIAPVRAREELYDCVNDPKNLKNLAALVEHGDTLKKMRSVLQEEMILKKDLGIFPEADLKKFFKGQSAYEFVRKNSYDFKRTVHDLFGLKQASEADLLSSLRSDKPVVRYWALIELHSQGKLSTDLKSVVKALLDDSYESVKIEAADLLLKENDPQAIMTIKEVLKSENVDALLHVARNVEMSNNPVFLTSMKDLKVRLAGMKSDGPATVVQVGDADLAMFATFSVEAYLTKQESNWISLFNGKDLTGWKYDVPGEVKVENGVISILAKKHNLWLRTERNFKNFELKVEVKVPKSGYNAGIGFRCVKTKKLYGFQCEIDQQKSGSIYAIGKGWLHPKKKDGWGTFTKHASGSFKDEKWNKFHIKCVDDHIVVKINGHEVTNVKSDLFKEGSIAIQHHGRGDTHYFRNIEIKELP